MTQEFSHTPVMVSEVVSMLEPVPQGVLVDATVGGGGHAAALLAALPKHELIGIDADDDAVAESSARLAGFANRARVIKARFDELEGVVQASAGGQPIAGVLFDLGVSSPQLDRPERGFSYRFDGPLDMRMDRSRGATAADLVNSLSAGELAELFVDNGEGRFARRIADGIVASRPIDTTGRLVEVIERYLPGAARKRPGHPAKRVFQALRIEVNSELDVLAVGLESALDLLAPKGRCVVLSYHSGEDRLVKQRFAQGATGGCVCPPGLPCVCGAVATLRVLTRGARLASADEVARNPRAASARLRAAERLGQGEAP
ncbi:MAG: 16S rRNA (cytosine(1402)-N(4))-methyltransferase RsmH [Acidimicrobiales bacterium]|jgi:16S rRNA (cytosine1402-N4)-methyltransferase